MEPFTSKVSKVSERVLFSDFRKYKGLSLYIQFLFNKEKGSLFNVKVWMKLLVKKSTPCYGNKIEIGIGYQVGKIYRNYCWDIISIMMAIMSTAIVIYLGEWIKAVITINIIVLLLLVHVVYIGIRCYVKDWREEREYY